MDHKHTDPSTHQRKLYVRPERREHSGYREVQMTDGRLLDGQRCKRHKRPVAAATFAWDLGAGHQSGWLSVRGTKWYLGIEAFERIDHADGTHCPPDAHETFVVTESPCRGCGEYDTVQYQQHAWHDEWWCTTPDCTEGVHKTRSIGD